MMASVVVWSLRRHHCSTIITFLHLVTRMESSGDIFRRGLNIEGQGVTAVHAYSPILPVSSENLTWRKPDLALKT